MENVKILEIRVHGVRNMPPAEMLGTTPENVVRHSGDDLGSFWRLRDHRPSHGVDVVEAFSWGALNRTGGSAVAAIGRAIVHVGWFLLLPFALANLAFWTRTIDKRPSPSLPWVAGPGAAAVRVFGLLLTLITVTAFSSVAINLLAIQCFRGTEVCSALPAVLDAFLDVERDRRAALFGLLPIAGITVLYVIGRRGRVRYEEYVGSVMEDLSDYGPLLSTEGFWWKSRITTISELLHVAACILMVLFILTMDAAYPADGCLHDIGLLGLPSCAVTPAQPIAAGFSLGTLTLMAAIVVQIATATTVASASRTVLRRRLAGTSLALAITGYGTWTALTFTSVIEQPDDGQPSLVLDFTPIMLVAVAIALALAGVGWKTRVLWRRLASAVLLTLSAVVLSISQVAAGLGWPAVATAVGLILAHLMIQWSAPTSENKRLQAWRGQGPAVAMILALFVAMALSSMLVLSTVFWLDAPAVPGEVRTLWRTPVKVPPEDSIGVPYGFARFAIVITAVAVVMTALVAAAAAVNLTRLVRLTVPRIRLPADHEIGQDEVESPGPNEYPSKLRVQERGQLPRIRRRSHLMHRTEPLIGWFAVLATVGFLALFATTVFDNLPDEVWLISNAGFAVVAIASVALVVAHSTARAERPLGVFWDVVAFFPRAGHPFAPPCYGERVVPELIQRTRYWFSRGSGNRGRAVIFTGHSMGSTICAAVILALRNERVSFGPFQGDPVTEHVALLSYGTQLRAYFSRFFPSVFGHDILGVPGLLGPSLWRADPWARQVLTEAAMPSPMAASAEDTTLTGLLGSDGIVVPQWRSLWRRTDYLGFPVFAYRSHDNPVDRGATEVALTGYIPTIATHGDYLTTPQFLAARDELVHALRDRPSLGPRPGWPALWWWSSWRGRRRRRHR